MTKLTVHYVATVSAQTLNHRSAFDKISKGSENKTRKCGERCTEQQRRHSAPKVVNNAPSLSDPMIAKRQKPKPKRSQIPMSLKTSKYNRSRCAPKFESTRQGACLHELGSANFIQ